MTSPTEEIRVEERGSLFPGNIANMRAQRERKNHPHKLRRRSKEDRKKTWDLRKFWKPSEESMSRRK